MVSAYLHQLDGASWLGERKRAILGDEPGLGKTRTLLLSGPGGQTLVICPAIVRTHWQREAALLGFPAELLETISYDKAVRGGRELMKQLLGRGRVKRLILDEFHYLKHPTSQRSQIILGKNALSIAYARFVPTVHLASGTPMPRNPLELWTTVASMFPHVAVKHGITTTAQWKERFCVTRPVKTRGVWRDKVVGAKNVPLLKEILAEIMLRRTLDDVGLDVPRLDFQVLSLDAKELFDDYSEGRSEALHELNRDVPELASIANDPHVARMRRRLGELKVAPVVEMVRSFLAETDEKIVIFAHHRTVLHALRELLKDFGVAYIDGDVGEPARDSERTRFLTDPRCRIFLGQNIACQTGLDGLQKVARRGLIVEPDWTPDTNYQLGKRIARIGSVEESRCVMQMVALAGTLDEAIVGQNARETRMVNEVLS